MEGSASSCRVATRAAASSRSVEDERHAGRKCRFNKGVPGMEYGVEGLCAGNTTTSNSRCDSRNSLVQSDTAAEGGCSLFRSQAGDQSCPSQVTSSQPNQPSTRENEMAGSPSYDSRSATVLMPWLFHAKRYFGGLLRHRRLKECSPTTLGQLRCLRQLKRVVVGSRHSRSSGKHRPTRAAAIASLPPVRPIAPRSDLTHHLHSDHPGWEGFARFQARSSAASLVIQM